MNSPLKIYLSMDRSTRFSWKHLFCFGAVLWWILNLALDPPHTVTSQRCLALLRPPSVIQVTGAKSSVHEPGCRENNTWHKSEKKESQQPLLQELIVALIMDLKDSQYASLVWPKKAHGLLRKKAEKSSCKKGVSSSRIRHCASLLLLTGCTYVPQPHKKVQCLTFEVWV